MDKEKIISYLKCDMYNYSWIIPPLIFYIFLGLILIVVPVTCSSNKEPEVKHLNTEIVVDTTTYPAVEVIIDEGEDFKISKSKYWSSKETGLIIGIVYAMDFAHGDKGKPDNHSNNYVTVKGVDGKLVITKDIDDDLYLNLNVGDTIR